MRVAPMSKGASRRKGTARCSEPKTFRVFTINFNIRKQHGPSKQKNIAKAVVLLVYIREVSVGEFTIFLISST